MCCLGIYLRSCGVPLKALTNKRAPMNVKHIFTIPKQAQWLFNKPELTIKLMKENDTISHKNKPRIIKKLFAKQNIEVEFIK